MKKSLFCFFLTFFWCCCRDSIAPADGLMLVVQKMLGGGDRIVFVLRRRRRRRRSCSLSHCCCASCETRMSKMLVVKTSSANFCRFCWRFGEAIYRGDFYIERVMYIIRSFLVANGRLSISRSDLSSTCAMLKTERINFLVPHFRPPLVRR